MHHCSHYTVSRHWSTLRNIDSRGEYPYDKILHRQFIYVISHKASHEICMKLFSCEFQAKHNWLLHTSVKHLLAEYRWRLTFWLNRFSGLGEVSSRTGLYSFFTREGPEGFQIAGVLFTRLVGDRGDLAFCCSKKDRDSGSGWSTSGKNIQFTVYYSFLKLIWLHVN